jgi:hypothetical protein
MVISIYICNDESTILDLILIRSDVDMVYPIINRHLGKSCMVIRLYIGNDESTI